MSSDPKPGTAKEWRVHYERARDIMTIEAAAIAAAARRLDSVAVSQAVDALVSCAGKAVVIGVGKSGAIGQKIAQTLTSTGTPAVFVHPSDALHGGLGIIAAGDVVIALSNSGETDELLSILPAIRRREVVLISIAGNTGSTLAGLSDIVLDASVDQEACPLNLAPTTSTTVALAIGDAIAMAVMSARGVTAAEFAVNHPAGQLGKRLTITVGDLMHASPAVAPNGAFIDVIRSMSRFALGAVNVVDTAGRLAGIITDGDLRRLIERNDLMSLEALTAEQMMTREPVTTRAETLAFEALQLMESRSSQISVLPVVDSDGRAVGLLRLHDIVRAGL